MKWILSSTGANNLLFAVEQKRNIFEENNSCSFAYNEIKFVE